MKLTMTVFGPVGVQKVMEHKGSSFKTCISQAIKDLDLLSKHVQPDRQKEWEKIEVTIQRH